MNNIAAFYIAIVIGIIALIVAYLYNANMALGYHPTRAIAALAVGVILIVIGVVGIVMARRRV